MFSYILVDGVRSIRVVHKPSTVPWLRIVKYITGYFFHYSNTLHVDDTV